MIDAQSAEEFEKDSGIEVYRRLVEAAAQACLESVHRQDAELSILLAGDETIQRLNREYLGIDAPTDVLSFPAGDTDPESGAQYLGDIIISLPRAQSQAASAGHSPADELQLLAVHGVLHLAGYDHAEPEDKAVMWALQAQVLAALGCAITGPALAE
jgi:probable rRNA maturation factor